jgi:hypothetical protein
MFLQDKTAVTVNIISQVNYIAPSLMHQFVQYSGVPSGKVWKSTKVKPKGKTK